MASTGASFRRVFGVAAVAGLTLGAATPAFAATDADCATGVSLDAGLGDDAQDIQDALDLDAPLICLSGTFTLTASLNFDHELTLHGLTDAVLDGNDVTGILTQQTNSTLTVEGLRFTRGVRVGSSGGAILGSSMVIRDSTFDHNRSAFGGAVFAGGPTTVTNSTFTENIAFTAGGALLLDTSSTVSDSTFSDNSAVRGGALQGYGLLTVTGSTFDENVASDFGGAIIADDVDIRNTTFVANRAQTRAGALRAFGGAVEQSTFFDNFTADATLGQSMTASGVSLRGNVFANSPAFPAVHLTPTSTVTDLGGNLFSTATEPGLASPAASTLFGASQASIFGTNVLASNGGPTQTVALSPTGPAVDAVPAGGLLTVDQRGVARAGLSDAGAFEVGELAAAAPALAASGVEPGWLAALAAGLLGLGLLARRVSGRRSRA